MLTPELEKRVRFILDGLRSDKIEINHTVRLLLWEIERDTVEDVMNIVPPHIRRALRKEADAMPRTEAEWSEWHDFFFLFGCFDPKVSTQQREQQQRDYEQRTRRAIEALRHYFTAHEG